MATIYEGLFIRDTLNDKGYIPSVNGAPTYSPDIICYQDAILSLADADRTYNQYICKTFLQGQINHVYIRVKNNGTKLLDGKAKAFYASSNILYQPFKWFELETESGETEVTLIGYDSTTGEASSNGVLPGAIGLGEHAFQLSSVGDPTKHYCMMGLVNNEDGSFIDLPKNFVNDAGLWAFLKNNPQIAYNNIKIIVPTQQTYGFPLDYGNYDEQARSFILNVEVQDGLDTLAGSTIVIQSTNPRVPFSVSYPVVCDSDNYCCEYTIPGRFFDYFEFYVKMPVYEKVAARLHITNYAVNLQADDPMTPDANLNYSVAGRKPLANSRYAETATMLGDFYVCLGDHMDGVSQVVNRSRQIQSIRGLNVTHCANSADIFE